MDIRKPYDLLRRYIRCFTLNICDDTNISQTNIYIIIIILHNSICSNSRDSIQ